MEDIINFTEIDFLKYNKYESLEYVDFYNIKNNLLNLYSSDKVNEILIKFINCYIILKQRYSLYKCNFILPTKSMNIKKLARILTLIKLDEEIIKTIIIDSYLIYEYFMILEKQSKTIYDYVLDNVKKSLIDYLLCVNKLSCNKNLKSKLANYSSLNSNEKTIFLCSCLNSWGTYELNDWINLLKKDVNIKIILFFRGDLLPLINNFTIKHVQIAFENNPIALQYSGNEIIKNEDFVRKLFQNIKLRQLMLKSSNNFYIISITFNNCKRLWSNKLIQDIKLFLLEKFDFEI